MNTSDPIAPHHAAWPWGVVVAIVILMTVVLVLTVVWLVSRELLERKHQHES